MNKQVLKIFIIFAILVGGTAILLARAQSNFSAGKAGVKIGNAPLYGEKSNLVATVSVLLPDTLPGYTVQRLPITQLELGLLPPDTTYGRRVYVAPEGFRVQVNAVVMGSDRTSIHKPVYCISGQGWNITKTEEITIPIKDPYPYDLPAIQMTTTMIKGTKEHPIEYRGIFIYWFVADGELTASHGERMWLTARDMFTKGVMQRWGYIACFAPGRPGQEKSLSDRLKSFIAESVPTFQTTAGKPVNEARRVAAAELTNRIK
jgi:hypothetical protein